MAKIISIHSFRGGTGKSSHTANLAALLAAGGRRVGVIDADVQSPGLHVLFGLAGQTITHSLNDYLWAQCDIEQTVRDVTANLGQPVQGRLFLIPASIRAEEIVNVLRHGYDMNLLTDGLGRLIGELALDLLIIDTHPGLREETLFAMAISGLLLIIMRPDQQDYEGTGVTVEVARQLGVPEMLLLVNKTPPALDPAAVRARVEQTYNCAVAAVLPHATEMMNLASADIFVVRYPDHPMTVMLKEVAEGLVKQKVGGKRPDFSDSYDA